MKIIGVRCRDCEGIALYIFDPENISNPEERDFDEDSIDNCMICLEDHVEKLSEDEIREVMKVY